MAVGHSWAAGEGWRLLGRTVVCQGRAASVLVKEGGKKISVNVQVREARASPSEWTK